MTDPPIQPTGRTTWLCPDTASRERLLDMDDRLKRPRAAAFGVLGLAVASSVPFAGLAPIGLLAVAVLGFVIVDRLRQRLEAPEYAIVGSWVFAELVIAFAVTITGGADSYALSWLAIPIITLPARFGARGVVSGVAFATCLLLVVTILMPAGEDAPAAYAAVYLAAMLIAVGLLSMPLMHSDVGHRADAVIDGLTGMLNRRALGHRLTELRAQAEVAAVPIAFVVGDVDRFKQVNDVHGHAQGDAVLVDVAYRLRKALRAFDLAYRLGGEEFLVVLPGATVADAALIAERMRSAVGDEAVAGLPITMSFGVAGSESDAFDATALMAAADAALYEAKAEGRDRVICARSQATGLVASHAG